MDELAPLIAEARRRFAQDPLPLRVAVDGVVVNGPADADRSDVLLLSGGGRAIIMVRGEVVENVAERDALERLVHVARSLGADGGGRD